MRFTPTHVGNTRAAAEQRRRTTGSPPRTWGIPDRCPVWRTAHPVHPHARGEYVFTQIARGRANGSPPRTWGILLKVVIFYLYIGSPPRTWGILRHSCFPLCVQRFTPTHVGNTCRPEGPGRRSAVHPHARGEYLPVSQLIKPGNGSPPRTWGIHLRPAWKRRLHRFTPTHVGNTRYPAAAGRAAAASPPRTWGILSPNFALASGDTVHPHARGEYEKLYQSAK